MGMPDEAQNIDSKLILPQFFFPCRRGAVITKRFGEKGSAWSSGFHNGTDIDDEMGAPGFAAYPGICSHAGEAPADRPNNRAWGRYVVLEHSWKGLSFRTYYAHLSGECCAVGQEIEMGQEIGKIGNTGKVRPSNPKSDGSHLCFCVFLKIGPDWRWVPPPPFFNHEAS